MTWKEFNEQYTVVACVSGVTTIDMGEHHSMEFVYPDMRQLHEAFIYHRRTGKLVKTYHFETKESYLHGSIHPLYSCIERDFQIQKHVKTIPPISYFAEVK